MGRLSDKLKPVNDAMASFEAQIEKDAAALMTQLTTVDKKRQAVMMAAHAKLDTHSTDLIEFSNELDNLLGNAPPAGASAQSLPPSPAPAEPVLTLSPGPNAWTPQERT